MRRRDHHDPVLDECSQYPWLGLRAIKEEPAEELTILGLRKSKNVKTLHIARGMKENDLDKERRKRQLSSITDKTLY